MERGTLTPAAAAASPDLDPKLGGAGDEGLKLKMLRRLIWLLAQLHPAAANDVDRLHFDLVLLPSAPFPLPSSSFSPSISQWKTLFHFYFFFAIHFYLFTFLLLLLFTSYMYVSVFVCSCNLPLTAVVVVVVCIKHLFISLNYWQQKKISTAKNWNRQRGAQNKYLMWFPAIRNTLHISKYIYVNVYIYYIYFLI